MPDNAKDCAVRPSPRDGCRDVEDGGVDARGQILNRSSTTPSSGSKSRLVSLAELAREWAVSRKTIRRLLSDGRVAAYLLSGARNGTVRYDRAEVEAWLRRQRERM